MKASVNGWMVGGFEGQVPVARAAKSAREMGYDAIELCFGAGELTPSASEASLVKIRKDVEAAGLEIASLATGGYWGKSLGSPDDAERAEALAFTQAYLKAAKALGVDAVLVIPGSVDVCFDPARPTVPAKTVYETAQQSIRSLLPLAEECGVILALENVWSKFLTGPFEYAAFIDSFDSPFIKAYFDAGNCLINGYSQHWAEILGARIARVHVKNFRRRDGGGTLADFTASLLDGDLDWAALFAALKSIGYNEYLTAEVIVGEAGMPNVEQSARVAKELKDLIRQYGA
jgi:hexulose-6-phosphate isomerase